MAATIFFFGGIAAMIFFIIKRQREKADLLSGGLSNSGKQLQAELEQTADQIIARMEERVRHLQYLIAEADERIIYLEKKLSGSNEEHVIPDQEFKVAEEPLMTEVEQVTANEDRDQLRHTVFALLDEGYDFNMIAKHTGLGKSAIALLAQMHKRS